MTVEKLKKVFSALSQTTSRAIIDYGPVISWDVDVINSKEFTEKYLMPYLNTAKICTSSDIKDCYYNKYYLNGKLANDEGRPAFYLNDGTLIMAAVRNLGARYFADIWADINGSRKPNKFGKDIFLIRYEIKGLSRSVSGKFMPADRQSKENALKNVNYGCNKTGTGEYCLNVIMADSWQIKEYYPW